MPDRRRKGKGGGKGSSKGGSPTKSSPTKKERRTVQLAHLSDHALATLATGDVATAATLVGTNPGCWRPFLASLTASRSEHGNKVELLGQQLEATGSLGMAAELIAVLRLDSFDLPALLHRMLDEQVQLIPLSRMVADEAVALHFGLAEAGLSPLEVMSQLAAKGEFAAAVCLAKLDPSLPIELVSQLVADDEAAGLGLAAIAADELDLTGELPGGLHISADWLQCPLPPDRIWVIDNDESLDPLRAGWLEGVHVVGLAREVLTLLTVLSLLSLHCDTCSISSARSVCVQLSPVRPRLPLRPHLAAAHPCMRAGVPVLTQGRTQPLELAAGGHTSDHIYFRSARTRRICGPSDRRTAHRPSNNQARNRFQFRSTKSGKRLS